MKEKQSKGKSTIGVHAGNYRDEVEHGMVTPVFLSTAYDYEDVSLKAYPRYNNTVNQRVVSEKIAALENGEAGMVFSSGLAAIMAVFFTFLKKGDHAVVQQDIYGGSLDALTSECEKFGIELSIVTGYTAADFKPHIKGNTRLLFIETPSNPLLKIVDIIDVASLKSEDLILMIDNTFASPINQNPIDLGIDVVMHSATKYLGGHSDILAGAIVTSGKLMEKIWETNVHYGGVLDANTCSLLERSLKTLELRVERQTANAQKLANYLVQHPKVVRVNYPGLPNHPGHDIAKRQMKGFGGMMSFEVEEDAEGVLAKLGLVARAMSLGGVESTACLPVKTSHSRLSQEEREKMGISNNLIRLSVGIENPEDIIEDLKKALNDS